jgi:hypothetical protein
MLLPELPGARWLGAGGLGTLAAAVAGIHFSQVVTLGSVLTAAMVVVMGGLFTLRNNIKTFWKNLAEERGEQIKVMEARERELAAELIRIQREGAERLAALQAAHTSEMTQAELAQQELRHELKGQLATTKIELDLERAKPDISELGARIDHIDSTIAARQTWMDAAMASWQQNTDMLAEIVSILRPVPVNGPDTGADFGV